MKHSGQISYKYILFVGFILPALVFFILSPTGPLLWFIIPGTMVVLSVVFTRARIPTRLSNLLETTKFPWVLPLVRWVLFLIYFFIVILYGTSIPREIYHHWFTDIPQSLSSPTDTVLWASLWLFCLLGLLIPRKNRTVIGGVSGILYSWFGILVLLWGSALGFFLFITIGGIYLIKKLGRPLDTPRIVWLGCLVCLVLFILSLPMPAPGVKDSWDQKMIRFIQIHFQNNTLILDLPGRGTRQIGNDFGPARGLSDRSVFELHSRTTGRYYLENQRSHQLGVQGWITEPNVPGNSPKLPDYTTPQAELRYLETRWGYPPSVLTIQNNTYIAPSMSEISGPRTHSTTVQFFSGNPERQEFDNQNPFLPEEIQNLVLQARSLDLNQQILLLRSTLSSNYHYSLTTRAPDAHQHPLDRFFEDKVGYCLHFATFGTLYFQALGYQAYFSEGYTGNITTATTQIRGIDSHAWVSIVLPDQGNIIVDPTPPIRLYPGFDGSYTLDRATKEYLQRLHHVQPMNSESKGETGQNRAFGVNLQGVVYPILIPVGFLVMFGIGRHFSPKKRWIRSIPAQGSSPFSYEHMKTLIGISAVDELYLPSLLRWYGYSNEPSYGILRKHINRVNKIMNLDRSDQ